MYIPNELTMQHYLFWYLKGGSSINFVNSILNQESLFIIKIVEDSEIMVLNSEDVLDLAKTDIELKDIISKITAKFNIKGYKYDFYNPYSKDYTSVSNIEAGTLTKKMTHSSTAKVSSSSRSNSNLKNERNKYLRNPTIISDVNYIKPESNNLKKSIDTKNTITRHRLEFKHIEMIINKQITKYPRWRRFIRRINKGEFILKLKEAWSMFCIVDIYFNQRMVVNLCKELNSEIRTIYNWNLLNTNIDDSKQIRTFIENTKKSISKWTYVSKDFVAKLELSFKNKILSIIRRKTKSFYQWFSKRHLERIKLIMFMLK